MSRTTSLEHAKYICSETQCLKLFQTHTKWKLHACKNKRYPCAQAQGILFNRFLPTLEQAGAGSELVKRFLARWEEQKSLPHWRGVFVNSAWAGTTNPGADIAHNFQLQVTVSEGGNALLGAGQQTTSLHHRGVDRNHEQGDATPVDCMGPLDGDESTDPTFNPNFNQIPIPASDSPAQAHPPPFRSQSQSRSRSSPRSRSSSRSQPSSSRTCPQSRARPLSPSQSSAQSPPSPSGPPQLYNPFGDDRPPCYTRTVGDKYIVYRHATAGAAIPGPVKQTRTGWERARLEMKEQGMNEWGIWETKREWEDAEWFGTAKLSQVKLDEVLATQRYASDPPNFGTTRNLYKTIDEHLTEFGGPEWHQASIRLPEAHKDSSTLYYRCPEKCGDALFSARRFAGQMAVAPELIYKLDDETRVYKNLCNGNDWDRIQMKLPPGATRGASILMSDATILSRFTGGVQVHALYLSLGNIDKSVREDISKGAWMLLAYIPKSNFEKTLAESKNLSKEKQTNLLNLLNRRLFHRCLEIITRPFRKPRLHEVVDPEGITRLVSYDLAVYGADLEEQCMIASIERNSCPHCESKGEDLGLPPGCRCARSSRQIMEDITTTLSTFHRTHGRPPDPLEFLKRSKEYGLNGVQKPFWRNLPGFDIATVLSPDLLHGYHKFFYDHIHKWNLTGLGPDEYDTRLKAQIPTPGEKMFPKGVSKLKQLAGTDHRALERVHVAIVAHAPSEEDGGAGSNRLTKATRAYMDCIFLAQLPVHTDDTLAEYESSYQEYHDNKEIWIKNKSKRGKSTKTERIRVNKSWGIPKQHISGHATEHIRRKGPLDNYNTETMEHLHRTHCKDPYGLTNHHEGWQNQVLRRLTRYDKIRDYGEFLKWNRAQDRLEQEQEAAEDTEDTELAGCDVEPEDDVEDHMPAEDDMESVEEEIGGGNDVAGEAAGASTLEAQESLQSQMIGSASNHVEEREVGDMEPEFQAPGPTIRISRAERTCRLLASENETFLLSNSPNYHSIPAAELLRQIDVPDFLDDLEYHPEFRGKPWLTSDITKFDFWDSVQLRIPTSEFAPEARVARIYAVSGLMNPRARIPKSRPKQRSDAVLYRPSKDEINREALSLLNCRVGRLVLIFSLTPSADNPSPRKMAYIQQFSAIPQQCSGTSGFHAVKKMKNMGYPRYTCIFLDQVIRPCPLAPIFNGPAVRGVEGHDSLDHYNTFYINKYRNPRDYAWIHKVKPRLRDYSRVV